MTDAKYASDRVLARLMALHPKKIDLSLGRMTRLLARLGHPERKLPPVFHIAGTNGKGSTAAYLRAMLEASGHVVHVYTSPHLVRFAERIRIAGKIIDEDALIDALEECERVNGPDPITFFEATTAAALLAFSRDPADAIILEVGLGGRLDATNVIDQPLVTAITPVSMDHEQFLGDTLELIAAEKAGIAKAGAPLVLGAQTDAARAVMLVKAAAAGAPVFAHGADWRAEASADHFTYTDAKGSLQLPKPNLPGAHQILNAGLAVACLRAQNRFQVSPAHMAEGLSQANWPARLQDISHAIALEGFPEDTRVWLDGGHNPAAGEILSAVFKGRNRPLFMIAGMLANKDTGGFLKPFAGLAARVYGIDIPGEDCRPAAEVMALALAAGIDAEAAANIDAALAAIKKQAASGPAPDILICGSLYLAGRALRHFDLLPQ